jgi:hypothetical protein
VASVSCTPIPRIAANKPTAMLAVATALPLLAFKVVPPDG